MLTATFVFWFVASGRAGLRPAPGGRLPQLRLTVFAEILQVRLTSCLQPLQSTNIVMISAGCWPATESKRWPPTASARGWRSC